jgi:hypothetical protein
MNGSSRLPSSATAWLLLGKRNFDLTGVAALSVNPGKPWSVDSTLADKPEFARKLMKLFGRWGVSTT